MDVLHSCRCCLRRPPDKGLTAVYTHLDKTEIYSDMLRECFNIHLVQVSDSGICEVCVGSLRDANNFKLQVQRSQAELQEALHVKSKITSFVVLSPLFAMGNGSLASAWQLSVIWQVKLRISILYLKQY
ncbi:uncharacterized protein LOC134659403 [Cydia amplana]|uniref:uncharacterized protein LOC134659403 n=1 Tax=Cydia amplana TaxID=1869771 RepID=UPI002FE5FE26